ncbi:hypothetical protein C6N75_15185 [Streptomyces solincola]|uniref:Uncharacterized protein n=1 Tax=Streptomyces solincola TaxID=2100817 RepID=A0A2S9PVB8_9ACTN|nr:hypothetical protein [Streptomyces solincola]PRH78376.1 hypothetical protein C6N75_15185 [Streptomyces solincola]
MSTMTLTAPAVQPAVFPPPSVPVVFTDGDRYEWPTGEIWTRTRGWWVPSSAGDPRDDGTGHWTDAEVRASLGRAIEAWDVRKMFVPARPGDLPTGPFPVMPTSRPTSQYVLDHQADRLVPLRDLVAAYDEDTAYDIPAVLTAQETERVVAEMIADHEDVRMSRDEAAGRIYIRYRRPSEFGILTGAGFPDHYGVECLHVFVLTASPAEA